MTDCPQTLDDRDGFTHGCVHDDRHDGMHECVCHVMWDDVPTPKTTDSPGHRADPRGVHR